MARGDTITDIITSDTDNAYEVITPPADEEWLITVFNSDGSNQRQVWAHENGSTDRLWLGDCTATWLQSSYNHKYTFNNGHNLSFRVLSSAPQRLYIAGFKTKDTS